MRWLDFVVRGQLSIDGTRSRDDSTARLQIICASACSISKLREVTTSGTGTGSGPLAVYVQG